MPGIHPKPSSWSPGALVTRGIGKAIGKALAMRCERPYLYITTRERNRGILEEKEVNLYRELRALGVTPGGIWYNYMNLLDQKSIRRIADRIGTRHERLDFLVNNAGEYKKPPALLDQESLSLWEKQVKGTVRTIYDGTKNVTDTFLPLMGDDARIINMTSHLSADIDIPGFDLSSYHDPSLKLAVLDDFMEHYIRSFKDLETFRKLGLTDCAYSITKFATNLYTEILQEDLIAQGRGISVNAICPDAPCTPR